MGRYLSLWTIDWTKIPVDPKERKIGFDMLMGLTFPPKTDPFSI